MRTKLMVMGREEVRSFDGKRLLTVMGHKQKEFDLGVANLDWKDIFCDPVDFPICYDRFEEPVYDDECGHCLMSDIRSVCAWLSKMDEYVCIADWLKRYEGIDRFRIVLYRYDG